MSLPISKFWRAPVSIRVLSSASSTPFPSARSPPCPPTPPTTTRPTRLPMSSVLQTCLGLVHPRHPTKLQQRTTSSWQPMTQRNCTPLLAWETNSTICFLMMTRQTNCQVPERRFLQGVGVTTFVTGRVPCILAVRPDLFHVTQFACNSFFSLRTSLVPCTSLTLSRHLARPILSFLIVVSCHMFILLFQV